MSRSLLSRRIAFSAGPCLVLAVLFTGCFHQPTGSAVPESPEHYDLFAMVWSDYDVNYPEFILKDADWKEVFSRYSPAAEQVETTEELIYDVLLPMLAELEDLHIWFRKPNGQQMPAWYREINLNYRLNLLLNNYLNPAGFTGWQMGVGCCDPELLPYISIDSWLPDLNLDRLEDFLESVQDEPAIIIDIRMNPGGNNILCGEVAGHFTEHPVLSQYIRYRTGPGYEDVNHLPSYTYPDNELRYLGTVYLLTGQGCASSSEDFILHMNCLESVVTLGDTTRGAACCPRVIELADGWEVTLIEWSTRGLNYAPVEGCGIPPDIFLEATEEDFAQGIDPVLEYAIELVNSHRK